MSASNATLRNHCILPMLAKPMPSRALLRLLLPLLCLPALAACAQSAPTTPPVTADAAPEPPTPGNDPGSGPDANETLLPPDEYHSNWRLVAADDPHDQALMALTIQSSAGETEGSGDYVLHQPFCDAVAGAPITGTTDCELIGMATSFDRVQATPERIVLAFHPSADGMEHRLELHRDGEALVGDYVADANAIRLRVRADRVLDSHP